MFKLYREQFGRWFAITAPTSLVAAAVLRISDNKIHAIYSSFPISEIRSHWADVVQAGGIRFGSFFLDWLIGCFALGAIATVLSGLDSDDDSAWRPDSHQRTREHFGGVLLIAIFTFCVFVTGVAVFAFIELAVAWRVRRLYSPRFNYAYWMIAVAIVAGIVSWFGAAIPIVLRGGTGAWAALTKSVRLSNGYEGHLFLLAIEFMLGSYVGWYATYYGLRLLIPVPWRYAGWYGWVVQVVAVLAAAAVEPPLFIGFSLLADPQGPPVL